MVVEGCTQDDKTLYYRGYFSVVQSAMFARTFDDGDKNTLCACFDTYIMIKSRFYVL